MQASSSFKQAFLQHMLLGLELGGVYSNGMSFHERKKTIKLLADAAMALARGGSNWSHALIVNLSKDEKIKAFVKNILGDERESLIRPCNHQSWKVPRSRKILRRSFRSHSRLRKGLHSPSHGVPANVIARRMLKKRTQVLKRIIPSGGSLDGFSLLGETLDYVIHLRAQVDLMRGLSVALDASNHRDLTKSTHCKKEGHIGLANDDI